MAAPIASRSPASRSRHIRIKQYGAARLAKIEQEAARKKAEVERQAEIERNGGYTDVFKEWGKSFLSDYDKRREREQAPTRSLVSALSPDPTGDTEPGSTGTPGGHNK